MGGEDQVMSISGFLEQLLEKNWQIAAAVVIVVVGWTVGTRLFGLRKLVQQFPKTAAFVELVFAPLTILIVSFLVRLLLGELGITGLDDEVRLIAAAGVYLVIAWCTARIIELWILSRSEGAVTMALPGLKRGLLYILALTVGLFVFLAVEGHSITGVFISTGAVAAIVAFAMQRTLGDFFSGIALSIESPFRVGDWIALSDGSEGQVIDVNWRATRLRGWDNATYVLPNGELASRGFKNMHGSNHPFAPWYEIKIAAEVDPRLAKAILLEAALRCKKVLKRPVPVVRLRDASTVPYTYMIWVHFANYPLMFEGREELYREIHYALKRAGIQAAPKMQEIQARKASIPKVVPPTVLPALKGLDIASVLTEDELETLASMSEYLMFDAGTILIHEGETADAFNVIINGIIESSVTLPSGSRKTVEQLSSGQYFGITSMMTTDPSALEFTALTDVSLVKIDTACLKSLFESRPDLSHGFARIVKQRLDRAEEVKLTAQRRSSQLTYQDIARRVRHLFSR